MRYLRAIDEIFSQFDGTGFAVRLWDGTLRHYGTDSSTDFTLVIEDEITAKRLLGEGSLGFGESYMAGRLRVEGDLESYLRLRHQMKKVRSSWRLFVTTLLAKLSTARNRKRDIAHHYDLGNDFFQMFLDKETMSYSAGRYASGSETLALAQTQKFELIDRSLALPANASVLDLGSGWGGFAEYVAVQCNSHVRGYSLSNAQLRYCEQRVREKHLEAHVAYEYRDMVADLPSEQFDAVVMIESIEHVGKDQLKQFVRAVRQSLKPGGSFYIQATGRYEPRPVDKWTLKYVFPGGYLPSKGELLEAAGETGFILEEFRDDTSDYIHTMSEWVRGLENHRSEIESMYGPSFYRLWELWMHGAKVGFETGSMGLFRIHLRCAP